MKCEHCGKNEVNFIYRSNVNGAVTEKHLCAECAEKLGVTQRLARNSQRMMQGFEGLFGRSILDDFFTPMPSLMSRMNRMLESPFDDLFADMPALTEKSEKTEAKQEPAVNEEEQSRFVRIRELNALRIEMKQAVEKEDFERAAQLRDKIRALEAEQTNETNHKESA